MAQERIDEWAIALQEKKCELQKCQQEHKISSCLKCEKLLACELRNAYVKSVYNSMNKGTSGGFEF
ncbi:MAG: hypothetical protein LGB54_04980 [Sulfurovum sp.]|nr:hypothetical protein [Sulfurovum sp.]MCB4759604.1 hypothetical protein [Sulfurovum sp.]